MGRKGMKKKEKKEILMIIQWKYGSGAMTQHSTLPNSFCMMTDYILLESAPVHQP